MRRRREIRLRILAAAGLLPLPRRTALNARISEPVRRDGYTIQNVAIQPRPGFYLCGNLYRPLPDHKEPDRFGPRVPLHGPYPGVLIAHGHWGEGRFANSELGSIPARAITFARQGYVAFTYDMVGYNDTRQVGHDYGGDSLHWLRGDTLMGLQTWDSIRALDYLCSLPDVDRSRLAMTGESGGGTQTMILGAIDDRLAAVAPCVMVSHTMQGGCLCENAPGLRTDFSNMEIAAAAAPKWQLIVGATGDWTATTTTVEGPAVRSVYQLLGAADRCEFVEFPYPHNINKVSREAVYRFFGRVLLGNANATAFDERPFTMDPVDALQVFPSGRPLPPDAMDSTSLDSALDGLARQALDAAGSRAKLPRVWTDAWCSVIDAFGPVPAPCARTVSSTPGATHLAIGRVGTGDAVPALLFDPTGTANGTAVVLTRRDAISASLGAAGTGPFVTKLTSAGYSVLAVDVFQTGAAFNAECAARRTVPFGEYFSTYNRTDLQERVADLRTALDYARALRGIHRTVLVGLDDAGIWASYAAPIADAAVLDWRGTSLTDAGALERTDNGAPCMLRYGGAELPALLMAPRPLTLAVGRANESVATAVKRHYAAGGAGRSCVLDRASGDVEGLWAAEAVIRMGPGR